LLFCRARAGRSFIS
jgi:chromate transporter